MKQFNSMLVRSAALVAISLLASVVTAPVMAAPGTLSEQPLYLGTSVKPNILFLVDDSTSMSYQVLKTEAAATVYPVSARYDDGMWGTLWTLNSDGDIVSVNFPLVWPLSGRSYQDTGSISLSPLTKNDILNSCVGYNSLAYNPNIVYTPWEGWSNASTLGYATARYAVWNDSGPEGVPDGIFQVGECAEPAYAQGHHFIDETLRGDILVTPTGTQLQNYANWATYYRSRINVMKSVLGSVIAETDKNVGLATLNNSSSLPVSDMAVGGNKNTLLSSVYGLAVSGYTPIRKALQNAGKYFDQIPDNNPESGFMPAGTVSPIAAASEGGSCQQNFTILTTDGYLKEDNSTIDTSAFAAAGISASQNADGDASSAFDSAGVEGETSPFADTLSNTIADVAMLYYENDLAPTIPNRVPVSNTGLVPDTNTAQHMVTYAVTFGVNGNIDAESYVLGDDVWQNTSIQDDSPETIDDLFHATVNGRGGFFSAYDPAALAESLSSAMVGIDARVEGSAASVGFNSTSISEGALLFQAWFASDGWYGDLLAFAYTDEDGDGELTRNSEPSWRAGELLFERTSASPRSIISFNSDANSGRGQGVVFNEASVGSFSTTQVADLDAASVDRGTLIQYLRGDIKGNEAETAAGVRNRNNAILGDIVHSSPHYVGTPKANYPDALEVSDPETEASLYYSAYVASKRSRTPLVYVGANDGMLHAFNGNNGQELFAYIPGVLFSGDEGKGLHALADPDYIHRPYVDSTATSGDIVVENSGVKSWATYLVGGLGAGGKGIYVLDVTDPGSLTTDAQFAALVKREFTHANLGYTLGRPQIGKLNNGKWAAIFGNGYNNTGHGQASLFILYLDVDSTDPSVYSVEIATGVGSVASAPVLDAFGAAVLDGDGNAVTEASCDLNASDCNGLSAPTILDLNSDGTIDRVYAGDVHGNLWAFDLSSNAAGDWDVAHTADGQAAPLIQACNGTCSASTRQPITTKPIVFSHSGKRSYTTDPNLMVLFGTGQYLTDDDVTTTDQQSFYGVWDAGSGYGDLTRSSLTARTLQNSEDGATRNVTDTSTVIYKSVSDDDSDANFGWYMNFPDGVGERVAVNPVTAGDYVMVISTIPESEDPCAGGGRGFLTAVNKYTGGQPNIAVLHPNDEDAGIVAGIALEDLPGGGVIIDNDILIPDSEGFINEFDVQFESYRASRRTSWSVLK